MIDTHDLNYDDLVLVNLASDESEEIEDTDVLCKFVNDVFVNIENNIHHGEIYGSSVVSYKKLSDNYERK